MKKKKILPPLWADRILEWYCDPPVLEDLQGDLYERFDQRMSRSGQFRARLFYFLDVLRFIRPYTLKRNRHSLNPSFIFMLPSYLKSSLRSMGREKLNTAVSISGLALGLAVFCLISLYVGDELKYDRYLPNAERIYRITLSYASASSSEHAAWAEPTVGPMLMEYDKVVASTSLVNEKSVADAGSQTFREEKFFYATTDYFHVFPYPLVSGSVEDFSPGEAVITESTARKYFGANNPLNETLEVDKKEFVVTAVLQDLPTHTDLKIDAILGTDHLHEVSGWTFNYILLKDADDYKDLQPKLDKVFAESVQLEFDDYNTKGQYHAEALPDVHFGSPKLFDTPKSSRLNIYLFSSIAFLILIIAGMNHLNLSLASATDRQLEVGIRKAIGAQNDQLRFQFLLKSILICFMALVLSYGLIFYCLPLLNTLTDKNIIWTEALSVNMIVYLMGSVLLLGIVSGSYPAFYLASVKPIESIKDKVSKLGNRGLWLKGSVVLQFTISLALIISTIFISRQMNLVLSKSHGMTVDPVMMIDVPWNENITGQVKQLRNELSSLAFVKSAAIAGFNSWPTTDMDIDTYEVNDGEDWETKPFNNIEVDATYFDALGLEFIAGRSFTPEEVNGAYETVVVNRAMVEHLGWKNPLEETVAYENGVESRVIGVIENFNFNSVKDQFKPMLIFPADRYPAKLLVRLEAQAGYKGLDQVEQQWRTSIKGQPFSFEFLRNSIQDQYLADLTMQEVFNFFVIVAISIACLGLFGLIAISTSQRMREVSIRKVFGARTTQLWLLLSKNYIALILIAFIISVPLTAIGLNAWLEDFVYRVPMTIDVFVVAGVVTILAALLAMSIHIVRATLVNPSKILNHE
ncbi:MAG: ABC transporter permease [Bacteroidota bacterium]